MPQATAYDAQGNTIPEERLGDAIAKGEAHFEEGARVHVVIGGKSGTVRAEDLPSVLARKDAAVITPGAVQAREADAQRTEEQSKYRSVGQFLQTGIESQLQGQSFGIYGAIAGQVAPDYAKELQARRETHPLWSAANELEGAAGAAVAGTVLTGGAGAAPIAEATGAGRALGAIARGITAPARAIGAVGRGAEVATAAGLRGLGYEGATAGGRILAGGLQTAAAGAAEGGTLGALHEATQAGLENRELNAERLLQGATHGAIVGGVAGGVLGTAGAAGKEVLQAVSGGKGFQEAVSDFAEKRAFKAVTGNYQKAYNDLTNSGANPDAINRVGRKLLDRGVPLQSEEAALKALGEQVEVAGGKMRAIAQAVDKDSPYFDMGEMVNTAKDIAAKYRQVEIGDYQKIAARIEKQVKPLEKSIDEGRLYRFEEAWQWRSELGKTVGWAKKSQDIAADAQKEFYGKADEALTKWVDRYGDDVAKTAWKSAKEDYHDFLITKKAAENLQIAREKNRFTSPSDYATGALTFLGALTGGVGAIASAAGGLAVSQAHKVLRERGPGAIARLADAVANVDLSLQRSVTAAVNGKAAPELLPRVEPIVVSEAAKPFLFTKGADKAPDHFEARMAEIKAVSADPKLLIERVAHATRDLGPLHPELVTALTAAVTRGNEFLLSKLPPVLTRAGSSLTPLAETPRVPPAERTKWMRYVEGVDSPKTVVARLAHGEINREGLEALKATQPETWAKLRTMVIQEVSARGEALPFRRRITLSLAFEFNGDKSLEPGALGAIQASSVPLGGEAEPAEPKPGPSPKMADSMAAPTDQMMGAM